MNTMAESTLSTTSLENDEPHRPSYNEIVIKMDTKLNKVSEDIDYLMQAVKSMSSSKSDKIDSKNINEPGIQASSSEPQDQRNRFKTSYVTPRPLTARSNVITMMSTDVSGGNSSVATEDESVKPKIKEKQTAWKTVKNILFSPSSHSKNTPYDHVRKHNVSDVFEGKYGFGEEVSINKNHKMGQRCLASNRNDLSVQSKDSTRFWQPTDIQENTANWAKQNKVNPDALTMANINTSGIPIIKNRTYLYKNDAILKHEGLEPYSVQERMSFPQASGYHAETIKKEMMLLDKSAKQNVKLILFGCSGYGKTSTINSLMGFPCLNTSTKMLKTEQHPVYHYKVVNGVRIKFVDTPGIEESINMSHLETIHKSLDLFNYSFSALLLVLKYGERFTQQTKSIVKSLKGILGEEVIENCCVCVMTNGEQFAEDMSQRDEPLSFEKWCMEQDPEIGMLFRECKHRCILFENKTLDKGKIKYQFDELLSIVKKLKPYTKSDFDSMTAERDSFWDNCSLPEIKDENYRKINALREKLHTIETFQDNEEKITQLNLLLPEVEQLRCLLPPQAKDINSYLDGLRFEIESKMKLIKQNQHFIENH